ncbi:single stranded DNA binding, replication factor-a protein [Naegleria gruberi]|uniref:Single stranded DNA binding, replication factor-a protein n=1 Tax=Naegleria gruberi TaxID=5762 RepID=D2VCI9_NAEGR|nr:single stranded DNA binding, replication factor-a protein [Naegleria gruberi]EFC45318.1 single stranded DNA binding, replication factor-a protein [Naegleria gruberi]|eukprot:XP_002678062.1 single stranded DNA binding, replication factor-a protein [Naegleria gruberi strain NEG-M]
MDIQASLGENNGNSSLIYPTSEEKFDKSTKKEMSLYVNRSESEFSYHTLILDACSSNLFTYDTKKRKIHFKDAQKIKELILKWTERSKDTRVVVIFSDKDSFRVSLNIPANHVNSLNVMHLLRNAIMELSLPSPVYYCTDNENKDIFLLICQIFYVYSIKTSESLLISDNKIDLPKTIFKLFPKLSLIDYSSFFSLEDLKSHSLEHNNTPISNNEIIPLDFNSNARNIEAPKQRRYPLLNLLSESENMTDESYVEYTKKGMYHGMILQRQYISYFEYKEDFFECSEPILLNEESQSRVILFDDLDRMEDDDNQEEEQEENPLERLKRLKEMYNRTKHLDSQGRANSNEAYTSVTVAGSSSTGVFAIKDPFGRTNSTNIPSQNDGMELSTASQMENAAHNQTSSTGVMANSVLADSKVLSALVVNMSIHQVMNHFGMTFFQRGRDYKNEYRIDNFKTKIINNVAFKLYSTCVGTRPEPYKQESIIKEGKLLKAICNCPIGAEGTCKHICAQILAFREKDKYMREKFESLNSSKSDRLLPPPIPFSQLDPVLDDWCIKVKVIKKHNEKSWANERGSGRVAAITIADELSGDMSLSSKQNKVKLIMFNDCINEFYDQMEEGESYYVNKGHLIKKPHEDFFEIQLLPHNNSMIEPSPEKKRKIEQVISQNNAENENIEDQEEEDQPERRIVNNEYESPNKKAKLPSIDTRFDDIMNAQTMESQHSIIASQPMTSTSNESCKSQIINTPSTGKKSQVIEEEVFNVDEDEEIHQVIVQDVDEEEDGPIFTSDNYQKPATESILAKSQPLSSSELATKPNTSSSTVPSNNNSQKSNHSSNSSSTPTPKPHYYFDENEQSQTFEDIFFTPFKTPQTCSTNKTTPSSTFSLNAKLENILIDDESSPFYQSESKTKDLIPDDDVQEIVNSQEFERKPMSPKSLSQHNKPQVLDYVVLSDNEEVEILDFVTPRKPIRKKTKPQSPIFQPPPPTDIIVRKPSASIIVEEKPNQQPESSNNSTSALDNSTTTPSSTKTPKKVSLKFLLDNNDMSDW